MRTLITGGAGFIGSHVVRHLLATTHDEIVVLDAGTYAASPTVIRRQRDQPRIRFIRGNVTEVGSVAEAIRGVDRVVHLAAETHVDRSIAGAAPFITSNVLGTGVLLDAIVTAKRPVKFLHVSTDEVYGPANLDVGIVAHTEGHPFRPSSPYAAAKASAELVVQAYQCTYGVQAVVARLTNQFGPGQYPEKFIPLAITRLIAGEPIPLYGDGRQVRQWTTVRAGAAAICAMLKAARPGAVLNVPGQVEVDNLRVAQLLCDIIPGGRYEHVADRPGHDRRYAVDGTRFRETIGWVPPAIGCAAGEEGGAELPPRVLGGVDGLHEELRATVTWYRNNPHWWRTTL